jgi:hypothetical protein
MPSGVSQPVSDGFYNYINGINDVAKNALNNQVYSPGSIMGLNPSALQMPSIGGFSQLGGGIASPLSFGSAYGMQGSNNIQQALKTDAQITDYQLEKQDKISTHQMKSDSDVETTADLVNTGQTDELMAYMKKLSPAEKINLESRYQQKTGKLLRADIRENCDGPYQKAAKAGGAGALTGAGIGFFLGGPPGALIGGAIGAIAGTISGAAGFSLHPLGFTPTDSDLVKELNKNK